MFKKIILGFIIGVIALCAIFYVFFAVDMFNKNGSKPVDADIVSECIKDLKTTNKDLKNVELYYQQGKIHANIYFENNLSLDESKVVIKDLRKFIIKENINKYFAETHMEDMPIRVIIQSKGDSYYYECPYYLRDSEKTEDEEKSYYKIWYLTDSNGKNIETINID